MQRRAAALRYTHGLVAPRSGKDSLVDIYTSGLPSDKPKLFHSSGLRACYTQKLVPKDLIKLKPPFIKDLRPKIPTS